LDNAEAEADPKLALTRRLREVDKRHRDRFARMREEVRAEVIAERKAEAGFRRLNVPEAARALFQGIDPADERAMAEQAARLREAGVTWRASRSLWVPDIRSPHATCAYSWISPPSRSRRTTLPADTTTTDSLGPSGGACPKAQCGRWPL
jgi:hypothetical protein